MPLPLTDWLDWTVAEYEVGAPATSLSFERWFRNPVAMAQGAAGAPRIEADAFSESVAGNTELFSAPRYDVTGGPDYTMVPMSGFRAITSGEVRVKSTVISLYNAGHRIKKNATTVASGTSSLSVDISFVAGDCIWVEAFAGTSGGGGMPGNLTIDVSYNTNSRRIAGCV